MSGWKQDIEGHDFDANDQYVRVEYGGFAGIARIVRVGHEALKWQITIAAENGRSICELDGPEVKGEGYVVPSLADIESVQHEINQVIEQFLWDPTSQM